MGYYEGQRTNPCPRCGAVVGTLFISVSPMSYSQQCGGCGATEFTPDEEAQFGDNTSPVVAPFALDPDPLTPPPEPLPPPRRSGCLSVLSLALLLAIALGIVVPAPSEAPVPGSAASVKAVAVTEQELRGAPLPGAWQVGAGIETRPLQRPGGSGLGRAELPRRLDGNATCRDGNWFRNCRVSPTSGAPTPTGSVGTALLGGYATFYEDPSQRIDHYAAAGPLLRDALGHWRGKVIRVTSGNRSTIVRLADFCACGERHGLPTLLDLSPEAFRDLASLSAGIVRVEIELVELPATDALPRNAADLRMQREVRGDELYR